MSKHIKIKKGLDIKLAGAADKTYATNPAISETFVIKPTDFKGIIPKISVQEGSEVKAGDVLFHDKTKEKIVFTSPVSGKVTEIMRGEKRKLLGIKILADKEIQYKPFKKVNPKSLSRDEIIALLLESGIWPFIRQRPFSTIANPAHKPKAIFISAFDSNPLAPDNDFIVHGKGEEFQTGLDAIVKLTDGTVHLNVKNEVASQVFLNSKGVQINKFSGPHPAGNVGVQIHHLAPIQKGDVVWYLYPQDVLLIGKLFLEGRYNATRVVALTGSEAKHRKYYKTLIGASVKPMITDNINPCNVRYISGNVLTGTHIGADGYIGFYDTQVTVLPEGNEPEFFGWLKCGFNKLSNSRTVWSWLLPKSEYRANTNMHGEERPFVVSGQYENVFPFDIYPVHLLKSIIIRDYDLMEQLGIFEVSEEDFALCEFVCTSKINAQEIVREGLELMMKEEGH